MVVLRLDLPFHLDVLVAFVVLNKNYVTDFNKGNNTNNRKGETERKRDEEEGQKKRIMAVCEARLDQYLVPFALHILPSLPLSASMSTSSPSTPTSPVTPISPSRKHTSTEVETETEEEVEENIGVDEAMLRLMAIASFNEVNVVLPRNAVETQVEAIWREQVSADRGCLCWCPHSFQTRRLEWNIFFLFFGLGHLCEKCIFFPSFVFM